MFKVIALLACGTFFLLVLDANPREPPASLPNNNAVSLAF